MTSPHRTVVIQFFSGPRDSAADDSGGRDGAVPPDVSGEDQEEQAPPPRSAHFGGDPQRGRQGHPPHDQVLRQLRLLQVRAGGEEESLLVKYYSA